MFLINGLFWSVFANLIRISRRFNNLYSKLLKQVQHMSEVIFFLSLETIQTTLQHYQLK